jgi:3-methylcrotonyl-CoA carboxylase alpha subunit
MEVRKFNKVLIANRGEIALRIAQTLNKLAIIPVVIYDEKEAQCLYVRQVKESYSLGTGSLADTFLNIPKIIGIAKTAGCEAIHPGYGFLSEDPEFAALCVQHDLVFIGPPAGVIAMMGNKSQAIRQAKDAGIPVLPQISGSAKHISDTIDDSFFPCLVKAAAGGGGKGMHLVRSRQELGPVLERSAREAFTYFGNGEVYAEKYISHARHIEVQILADASGNCIHLFDRECSIQRRFQKVIEEAPSSVLDDEQRKHIYADAIKLARSVNYIGAGTVEFLADQQGNYYFLEMNTRLQVEHAVTEMITGIDIVEEQIAVAANNRLSEKTLHATIKGHAIEARLYAEDPAMDFLPSPGTLERISFPDLPSTRIDTIIRDGYRVQSDYDPMLAKLIALGENRQEAISRLTELLKNSILQGIHTNIEFLVNLLGNRQYHLNNLSTQFIEEQSGDLIARQKLSDTEKAELIAIGTTISLFTLPVSDPNPSGNPFGYWRLFSELRVTLDDQEEDVRLFRINGNAADLFCCERQYYCEIKNPGGGKVNLTVNGKPQSWYYSWNVKSKVLSLSRDYRTYRFTRSDLLPDTLYNSTNIGSHEHSSSISAPLNGKVYRILGQPNGMIEKGETLLIIESMKMENEIKNPRKAIIKKVYVEEGQMVNEGELLMDIE